MSLLLIFHVLSGSVSVLAGMTALFAGKGAKVHRAAGAVFVAAMPLTALAGAWSAALANDRLTFLAGLFTCYLVATAWTTLQPRSRWTDGVTLFCAAGAAAICIGEALCARAALSSASGTLGGYTAEPFLVFAGLAALAVALDLSVVVRRGLTGAHRIARHIWRIGFAVFIAVGSLFTGPGMAAFPEAVRGSPLLSLPELTVALMVLFWLGVAAFTERFRQTL